MVDDAPLSTEIHPLVALVEDKAFESFGFYLFRVDYEDEERWNLFLKEYDVVLQSYIASASESSGLARIRDKFEVIVVEDEVLDGVGNASVASAFKMLKVEGEVSPGFDLGVCLVADAECIASVLDHDQKVDESKKQAFLKVVRVTASRVSIKGGTQRGRAPASVEKVDIASLATTHYLSFYESANKSSANATQ